MIENVRKHPYLGDPNYYRLAYQLAAQQVNWGLASRSGTAVDISDEALGPPKAPSERADDGGIGAASEPGESPLAKDRLKEGMKSAKRLADEVEKALAWYRPRVNRPRWKKLLRLGRLRPRELRLSRFLEGTVGPCVKLLLAGTFVYLDEIADAEDLAGPIRTLAQDRKLSYRAYYNLACYEVALGADYRNRERQADETPTTEAMPQRDISAESRQLADAAFRSAIENLREALGEVYGKRRAELIRWAQNDPSLAGLRASVEHNRRLEDLLTRYEVRQTKEPPSTDSAPKAAEVGRAASSN